MIFTVKGSVLLYALVILAWLAAFIYDTNPTWSWASFGCGLMAGLGAGAACAVLEKRERRLDQERKATR